MWNQVYDPFNNIWVSATVAALPIVIFILLLTVFKLRGWIAALIAAMVATLTAWGVYGMPADKIAYTATYGVLGGVYPVATIVIAAIFLYKISVKSGKFEIIKESIISITPDRRIQVLLIAYCFGAFLEGAAGFGAPVAITAIILVGLGFNPVQAAGLCLVANIAGGSYGAMGIPVTTPSMLTGLDPLDVAARTSYLVPLVAVVLPFILVFLIDGLKGIRETLPATALCGVTFASVQWVVLNTLGAPLVDILSASVTIIVLMVFLRGKQRHSIRTITYAWLPFIMLTGLVIITSFVTFEKGVISLAIPHVHNQVFKIPPVVSDPTPFGALFNVDLFTSTTSAIVAAGILTVIIYRIKGDVILAAMKETIKELAIPIVTICAVLAFAYICNYSGMSSTLGLAFASTGDLFPLFSPVLGWIGVFLTGSVVNSGSLFAPLQSITAAQIGIEPAAMVAANVIGGDMAKMISPQSIAVASAAVGMSGRENEIFRYTIRISVIMLAVMGILNLIIY